VEGNKPSLSCSGNCYVIIGYCVSIDGTGTRPQSGSKVAQLWESKSFGSVFVQGIIPFPVWAQNYISIWITSHHQRTGNQSTKSAEQILKALTSEHTAISAGTHERRGKYDSFAGALVRGGFERSIRYNLIEIKGKSRIESKLGSKRRFQAAKGLGMGDTAMSYGADEINCLGNRRSHPIVQYSNALKRKNFAVLPCLPLCSN